MLGFKLFKLSSLRAPFGSLCFELFHFCLSEFFQWLFCFLMHFFLFWTHGVTHRVPPQIQGGMERRTLSFPFFVAAPVFLAIIKAKVWTDMITTQFLLCLPLAEPDFCMIFLRLLFCLFHCWFYLSPSLFFLVSLAKGLSAHLFRKAALVSLMFSTVLFSSSPFHWFLLWWTIFLTPFPWECFH